MLYIEPKPLKEISHTHKFSLTRLILNSIFPLSIIIGHVFVIAIMIPHIELGNFFMLILLFILMPGVLSIPSLILVINFTRKSIGRTVYFTENSITLEKNGTIYKLNKSEISKILRKGHNETFSRVPWLFMEHIVIFDNKGKSIVISSFMANISKLFIRLQSDKTLNSFPIEEENSLYEPIE